MWVSALKAAVFMQSRWQTIVSERMGAGHFSRFPIAETQNITARSPKRRREGGSDCVEEGVTATSKTSTPLFRPKPRNSNLLDAKSHRKSELWKDHHLMS